MDDITATLFADLTAQLEDAAGQAATLNTNERAVLVGELAGHLGRADTLLEAIQARCSGSDNTSSTSA